MSVYTYSDYTAEDLFVELRSLLRKYCELKNKALNNLLFPNDFIPGLDDGKWSDYDVFLICRELGLEDDITACPHCVYSPDKRKDRYDWESLSPESIFVHHCPECLYGQLYGQCIAESSTGGIRTNPDSQYHKIIEFIKAEYRKLTEENSFPGRESIVGFLFDYKTETHDKLDSILFEMDAITEAIQNLEESE